MGVYGNDNYRSLPKSLCILHLFYCLVSVADLEGVQGVRLNPPLETDYFIFMENFKTFCVK